METVAIAFVTSLASVGASAGFWSWMQKRSSKRDAVTSLLLGLAHDSIINHGLRFLDRGWITKDEYEDLFKYLWTPYSEFGGNGLAEKVMLDVARLPIRGHKTEILVTEKT